MLDPIEPGGFITAGNASQISDGSAALLICNEAGLRKLGVKPRAVITTMALAGTDPVLMYVYMHGMFVDLSAYTERHI